MDKKCHFIIIDKLVDLFLLVVFELGWESTPCNFRSGFFPKSNENEATVQKGEQMQNPWAHDINAAFPTPQALVPVRWLRSMDKHKSPKRKKATLSPPYDPSLGWRGSKKSALILLSVLLPFSPTPRVLNGRHKQAWKWYSLSLLKRERF